jgi:hypothetical protein
VKDSGATAGATNGTYYAAYVFLVPLPPLSTLAHDDNRYKYFEKVRILEGKKKTEKRKKNEAGHLNGLPRDDRRKVWVFGPA